MLDVVSSQARWNQGSFLKGILTLCLLAFLVQRILSHSDLQELWTGLLIGGFTIKWPMLVLAVLMVLPNWVLEAMKLKVLMSPGLSITLGACVKSVVSGVSLGIVTPARLGEYGGRALSFPKERRAEVVSSTFITSLGQSVVTFLIGSLSCLVLLPKLSEANIPIEFVVKLVGAFMMALSLTFFFKLQIKEWLKSQRFYKRLQPLFSSQISQGSLLKVLGLSLLRYGVYLIQFVLVLHALGVEVGALELLKYLPVVFLLQTMIPLPPISGLVGRATAAVLVLGLLDIADLTILSASALLWVINLVLPAFVGLGFLWRSTSFK